MGSTLGIDQNEVYPEDLLYKQTENDQGWLFEGPVKIEDIGEHWSYEKVYHRCALQVNRDGTLEFRHIKQLVEQYPGYP